jgi:hypothetical protein
VLQRGDVDIGEHKRSGGTRGCGGFLELGIGDGKKGYDGDGIQTVVEPSGGEKLLSRRVAEIKEEGLPLFGIEAAKRFGERRGTANLKGGRWGVHNGLGDLEPEGQFAQEKNLRASD